MKYLKYPLFILAGLILIGVVLSFLGPKDLNVSESITINAPAPVIFSMINNLEESVLWNAWSRQDSTMVSTYNNIKSGVGASSSWKSDASGNGTQTITKSIPNQSVRSVLNFEGSAGDNFTEMNIRKSGTAHDISWSFEGTPLPFWLRGYAMVSGMKKEMSTNYKTGLINLKELAEERASGSYDGYAIKEVDMPERHFIMNRQEVETANIQQFYATNLGAIFLKVQNAGQEMSGMPCGLFFKNIEGNGSTTDMAAGIPVANPISIEGSNSYSISNRRAITLDFYGDYNQTITGHNAIRKYMKDRGYLQDPPIIEEYVTDPTVEKDVSKWLTKVTYYFSTKEG